MTKTSTLPAPRSGLLAKTRPSRPPEQKPTTPIALADARAGAQEFEAALQVADGLGVGAGVKGVAGAVHVRVLDHGQEPVAAVEGGDDGGVAQGGVTAGHVLHVLFVAVDAVDEEQAGVRAVLRWAGDVGRHRVAVVAADGHVVGGYVSRVVHQAGRQRSGYHGRCVLVPSRTANGARAGWGAFYGAGGWVATGGLSEL